MLCKKNCDKSKKHYFHISKIETIRRVDASGTTHICKWNSTKRSKEPTKSVNTMELGGFT
jgi:hypothetical protein